MQINMKYDSNSEDFPLNHLIRQLHFSWNEIEHEFSICRYGIWVYMFVYPNIYLQICLHMCIFVCLLCIWHRTLDTDEWLELTCNYRVRSQAPQNPIGSCLCGFLLKSYCMQLALTIFKRYRRLHICHQIYTILNSTCVKHCTLNYDIHAQQNPLDLALGALSASLRWQRIPFTELKLIKSTIRLTNGSDEHQIRLDLTLCFKDCHIVHDVIHLSHLSQSYLICFAVS